MKTLFLDFETYYDNEYSLRKMTPVEYVLDPRFEAIGCAVKEGITGKPHWVDGPALPAFFKGLDPNVTSTVTHNALFDNCVMAWRFGFVPKLIVDTLGIARACLGAKLRSLSLESVALHLSLGVKGGTVHQVKGMGAAAIKLAGLYEDYVAYSLNDVELCAGIYDKLVRSGEFPMSELVVMDTVLRCAIEPVFELDKNVLAEHLHTIKQQKDLLLTQAMMLGADGKTDLMSNERFAALLRNCGVEPPTKTSLVTGRVTYAFSKGDPEFVELQEHESPAVQALIAARLGHKSTLEESRAERLQSISRLTWPGDRQALMPVPLRFSGAHTHRLCLDGATQIITLRGNRVVYTRLDDLHPNDLVWDGDMFVAHGGLAYAGVKKVIEYDGVVGTPDHRVWTVERGYRPLAEAKARGYHIARGRVPDATRIDPAVLRAHPIQDPYQVHLREVRSGDAQPLERSPTEDTRLVSFLPKEGTDAWKVTFLGNVGARSADQPRRRRTSEAVTPYHAGAGRTDDAGDHTLAGEAAIEGLAAIRLGRSDDRGAAGISAMHQSECEQLRLLRRSGGRVRICIDGDNGGLDFTQARSEAARHEYRSHRHKRALRTGQPTLGDPRRADEEPKFVATWDIVDCGPRNRFVANGRIVHNSGDWKLNLQNLPTRGGSNALRRALTAPPGYSVFAVDASQIEARIVAWICGQTDLVAAFDRGDDVYSMFASEVFGYPVNKKQHPAERFVGKTGILGLGYGVGWPKFQTTVKLQSKAQTGQTIELSDEQATGVVRTYRSKYSMIPLTWRLLAEGILVLAGNRGTFRLGPCVFSKGEITGPNGLKLFYTDLKQIDNEWLFTFAGKPKRIYGGALLENIVQFLARIVVMDAGLRIRKRIMRFNLQVHDELVYVVKTELLAALREIALEEMARRPFWAPDLPLASEAGHGQNYGEAK